MTISVTETALEKEAIGRCARPSRRLRVWLAWIYCVIFLISSAAFYALRYTDAFDDYVLSQLKLRNGTHSFKWWMYPPNKTKFKIYIFNYTNWNEFEAGKASKLHVQEVGPYIYNAPMNRTNVELHDNGTVTFQTKTAFEWIGGRFDNDTVLMPNVPLMFATAYVRDLSFAVRFVTNTVLSTLQEEPFIKETVNGFLWGYDTQLFHMAKPLMMLEQNIPFEKFGLMAGKLGIDADRITIHTGTRGMENFGVIDRVNGMDRGHIWDDEQCDKMGGTLGDMFPPHLTKDTSKPLYVYIKEFCTKLPFHFTEHTTTYGIPSLRYKFSPEVFNFTDKQNECYCRKVHGTRVCPPSGLFNISTCAFGVPLLSSFPHFYGADKSLLEQIDGLNPRKEDHETYVDLHPRIAVPMRGWLRLQVNVEVRRAIGVPFLGNLKDGTILPLFWVESGADEVSEEILEVFEDTHFTVANVEMALQWGSLITVILSLSAMIVCFWKCHMEQNMVLQRTTFIHNNLYEV